MTSKKLGRSYSHEKRHSESLFIRSVNVVEKREFLRRNLEKILTGNQFVISKSGSGLRSRFQNQNLEPVQILSVSESQLLTKISSEEGVQTQVAKKLHSRQSLPKGVELKSRNHTPELKVIKLPKRRGGEVFFTMSVERVRVKPKNYLRSERGKVFEEK